ncbi:sulfite exporter TauE/SafE family protein, partial [candidate division WOR-3 bacterium]|nr:sulfite exporter TauE/SafE family protein [candidate division WOR-3 bacterium]
RDTLKGKSAEKDRPELMTRRNLAIATVLSASTGFISGSMGIGGGAINVLILVGILGFATKKAAGTSSFKTVFTAITGISIYLLSGIQLNTEMAIILAPMVLISSYGGSLLGLKKLKGSEVRILFIGGLFLAAAKMLLELL